MNIYQNGFFCVPQEKECQTDFMITVYLFGGKYLFKVLLARLLQTVASLVAV